MKEIVVKTQQEFDALPSKFDEYTRVIIENDSSVGRIILDVAKENSSVVVRGDSSVALLGNSSVVAYGNASIEAWENSSVEAWENSSIKARNNSSVEVSGNGSVVAKDNSSVVAYGNSSVVAYGNSSVVAYGNSSVVTCGNSSVEAFGNSGVHLKSINASVLLYMFAVCWVLVKNGKVESKSKTATIITPQKVEGVEGWLEEQGLKIIENKVILFKRVSSELKTQEKTPNETIWEVGKTLEHANWNPEDSECGEGKFHACSRPYFCDEFRSKVGDKYIAISVDVKDLYIWSAESRQYPHKVAFRKGKVLYLCDKRGNKLEK